MVGCCANVLGAAVAAATAAPVAPGAVGAEIHVPPKFAAGIWTVNVAADGAVREGCDEGLHPVVTAAITATVGLSRGRGVGVTGMGQFSGRDISS